MCGGAGGGGKGGMRRAVSSTAAELRPKSTLSARLNVSTPSMHSQLRRVMSWRGHASPSLGCRGCGNDAVPTSAAESDAREAMSSIAVKARHQTIRHRIRRVGLIASRFCQVPSRSMSEQSHRRGVRACVGVCVSVRVRASACLGE